METKEYRLTDVCDFQGGTQPPKEEWITEPRDGYVRMLQIRDFTQDKAEHVGYVKDTKKLNKCEEDDILIGRYGASVGKILTGLAGAYNVAIIKTIPTEELLSKRYLYYVLTGTDFQNFILNIGARAAQAGFNKNDLSLYKLRIPTSIKNQERIADVLEKAKTLVEQREKSISLLADLLNMKFLKLFGNPAENPNNWPVKKLGEHIKYIGDIGSNGSNETVAKNLKMHDNENYAIMIRTVNLSSNNFESNLKFISKETYDFFSKSKIYGGEIIMNKIGSAGEFWLMPNLGRPVSLGLNQLVIRLKDIETSYLYYYLSTNFGKLNIKSRTRGSSTKSITKSAVKDIPLQYPPLKLQTEFAEIVNQVNELKIILQNNLLVLGKLFNSLNKKALKGKLEITEKILIEGSIKIKPKISGEVIAIDKINKELEEFHKNQPHTGAPDEIDNTIRQFEAELKIKGEIPFWDEYVKYRILKGKFKEAFTFEQLWEEITKFPFETVPEYDEVATLLFKWLAEENAFIRQQFNESTKQIEIILNETVKA